MFRERLLIGRGLNEVVSWVRYETEMKPQDNDTNGGREPTVQRGSLVFDALCFEHVLE
jgi:hypothetical protein